MAALFVLQHFPNESSICVSEFTHLSSHAHLSCLPFLPIRSIYFQDHSEDEVTQLADAPVPSDSLTAS